MNPMAMADPRETDRNCYIPNEILDEIITRLPAKSLTRFKCVSKQWRSSTSTDHHYHSHHARSCSRPGLLVYTSKKNEHDSHRFFYAPHSSNILSLQATVSPQFGSTQVINGLVCFYALDSESIYLSNISTHETINLPTLYSHTPSFALGFDRINRIYKLLQAVFTAPWAGWINKLAILTIDKDNKYPWKEIDIDDDYRQGMDLECFSNACINSAFYWFPRHELNLFRLDTEEFEAIPYPTTSSSFTYRAGPVAVAEIGGRLALTQSAVGIKFLIWMLDDKQKTWDNPITIHLPLHLHQPRYPHAPMFVLLGTPPGSTSNEILFTQPRISSLTTASSKCWSMPAYSYDLTMEKWNVTEEESAFSPSSSLQPAYEDCTIKCYHHVENIMLLKDILAEKQPLL